MRPWTEKLYGIPPEHVVGSRIKTKFKPRAGRPVLARLPELNFIDDKEGKPAGIQQHIGRRPIAAFGNSDGDLQMLQRTAAGSGPRFCLYVHHTDAQREWAYDRNSGIGMNKTSQHAPENAPESSELRHTPRRGLPRLLRALGLAPLGMVLLVATLWATAALYYDVRVPWLRTPLALGYALALLAGWVFLKCRWLAAGVTAGGFALVLAWWLTLRPSNDRDWQPDVAVLAYADISGNQVTLHNIRNNDYRTETDFDVRHYDKTFDLDRIRTADLFMVYWGSPNIAHTMVSFGFEGGDYICFSVETRKQKGEAYSAVKGLFRQFELVYVAADERDLVRLRTNYRQGEEAYLFRLKGSPQKVRVLFLDYLRRLNSLRQRAEWYSAVTHNCTTSIRMQRAAADRAPWDWRMLANGHGDELLYERGMIATNLPLAELKQRVHVNARARAADKAADFSRLIRQGVPGIDL